MNIEFTLWDGNAANKGKIKSGSQAYDVLQALIEVAQTEDTYSISRKVLMDEVLSHPGRYPALWKSTKNVARPITAMESRVSSGLEGLKGKQLVSTSTFSVYDIHRSVQAKDFPLFMRAGGSRFKVAQANYTKLSGSEPEAVPAPAPAPKVKSKPESKPALNSPPVQLELPLAEELLTPMTLFKQACVGVTHLQSMQITSDETSLSMILTFTK